MAKMYTLDNKLLTDVPEVRIGERVYTVDNRQSTVKRLMKQMNAIDKEDEAVIDSDELIIRAAFGKKAKEILESDLPFAAQAELANLAMSAMTGEEYKGGDRFQGGEAEPD